MPHAGLGYSGNREPADARLRARRPRATTAGSHGGVDEGRWVARTLLRRLAIALHRRTTANQVPVAVDVVDAPDRWPVLVLAQRLQREEGLLLRIRPRPLAIEQQMMRVGGAAQRSCSWYRAKI